MFGNKKNYILTVNFPSELRLEESGRTNIISRMALDNDLILNENEIDEIQLSYVLNKILSEVNESDNLIIRYSSPHNIFRIKKVEGIEESDLNSYIKYNLDELIPFSKYNLEIESQLVKEHVAVFGIDKKILNSFKNILEELAFKNIYFTLFTSEFLNFWNENNINNFLFFNIEADFLEYFIIEQKEFTEYRIIDLEDILISGGCIPEDSVLDKMNLLLNDILKEKYKLPGIKYFYIGDWALINIWNKLISENYGKNLIAQPFDVIKYFGVKK